MRPLIFNLLFSMSIPAIGAEISMQDVEKCFAEPDRLDRLLCYDNVLGRPDSQKDTIKEPEVQAVVTPPSVRMFDRLYDSEHYTDESVAIKLHDGTTGFEIDPPEDVALIRFLEEKSATEEFGDFSQTTDLFLTTQGMFEDRPTGGLIMSCENKITNVRFLWDEPLKDRVVSVRLRFGETLSDAENSRYLRMRTSEDRHFVVAPRGIEAIRLLISLTQGTLTQVSVGTNENIRSMFFDAKAISDALPYIARHCGWTRAKYSQED